MASLALLAPGFAGSSDVFYGGFPGIAVVTAAARSQRLGWAVAGLLSVVTVIRFQIETSGAVLERLSSLVTYLMLAGIVGWAVHVIYRTEMLVGEPKRLAPGPKNEVRLRPISTTLLYRLRPDPAATRRSDAGGEPGSASRARVEGLAIRNWGHEGGLAEAIRTVAAEVEAAYGVHVEVVTVGDTEFDFAVVRAGARGYVTKTISPTDLADAIRRVASGDAVFSPRLAGFVLDAFSSIPVGQVDPELDLLSDREREVLQLIARGYTYREVGEELFISIKTVESHVSAVLRKLQLSNRNELTRWAAERRLIKLLSRS